MKFETKKQKVEQYDLTEIFDYKELKSWEFIKNNFSEQFYYNEIFTRISWRRKEILKASNFKKRTELPEINYKHKIKFNYTKNCTNELTYKNWAKLKAKTSGFNDFSKKWKKSKIDPKEFTLQEANFKLKLNLHKKNLIIEYNEKG